MGYDPEAGRVVELAGAAEGGWGGMSTFKNNLELFLSHGVPAQPASQAASRIAAKLVRREPFTPHEAELVGIYLEFSEGTWVAPSSWERQQLLDLVSKMRSGAGRASRPTTGRGAFQSPKVEKTVSGPGAFQAPKVERSFSGRGAFQSPKVERTFSGPGGFQAPKVERSFTGPGAFQSPKVERTLAGTGALQTPKVERSLGLSAAMRGHVRQLVMAVATS